MQSGILYEYEMTLLGKKTVFSPYFFSFSADHNERIALDDFISKVKDMEGDFVVEVKDDKASLKAYNNIIESLEELKVSITEK